MRLKFFICVKQVSWIKQIIILKIKDDQRADNINLYIIISIILHSCLFQLEKHAQDIYNKYLSPKAASPVNLDGACRELVEEAIKNPTPEMFRTQQQQVGIHNWKWNWQNWKYLYLISTQAEVWCQCSCAELSRNKVYL